MSQQNRTVNIMNLVRPWLYIGKYRDTIDGHLLSAQGVGAMLQLAEVVQQPGVISLYLPVYDGVPIPEELLRQGVDFVLQEKRKGRSVLIACGSGVSRSVAFAIAVLKEVEGLNLLEALRDIRGRHSQALPHRALWESLCRYYEEEALLGRMSDALESTGE
jgi:hypothetical protein